MNIKQIVKNFLGDTNSTNYKLVEFAGKRQIMHEHDRAHVEVSKLQPILMGGDYVNGIDGIDLSIFHQNAHQAKYSGFLDEARVGIHQVFVCQKPIYFVRLVYWCLWLACQGINPVAVVIRHSRTLR